MNTVDWIYVSLSVAALLSCAIYAYFHGRSRRPLKRKPATHYEQIVNTGSIRMYGDEIHYGMYFPKERATLQVGFRGEQVIFVRRISPRGQSTLERDAIVRHLAGDGCGGM